MYKTRKRVTIFVLTAILLLISVAVSIALIPRGMSNASLSHLFGVPSVVFGFLLIELMYLRARVDQKIRHDIFDSGENKIMSDFIARMQFCYSLDDFYKAIADILEQKLDCSVLLIDCEKSYVLYNSPSRITSEKIVRDQLMQNFPISWEKGVFFLNDTYGITSDIKNARGFFVSTENMHLFIFCRATKLFDSTLYDTLFEDFTRFISRARTITTLTEISELTKQWEQLADTQVSFLPQKIPDIPHLKIATYYRPLVNVSGDYYSILPISKTKTLLMLGDVSGKGLPAALLMGLVMNTVKIINDKEDLVGVLNAVDKGIKSMRLQDKYTVLFLSIVDTEKMRIRYINASMSDPIILSRAPDGYRIKPLASNASLVGILDMGEVKVAEQRLFRGDTILMATDGVSEVMDDNGVELGDTDIYKQTLQEAAAKQPQQFVDDIVKLIEEYNGNKKLHDDVTMMVAKVGI